AERHGLVLDLLDAAPGADRLVVEPDSRFLLVGIGPLGIDRIGERRTGTRYVGGLRAGCAGSERGCHNGHPRETRHRVPHLSPLLRWKDSPGAMPKPAPRGRPR